MKENIMTSPRMSKSVSVPSLQEAILKPITPNYNACHITQLSTELVCHIIDFLPPESHLDFACACKRIADCSSRTLKRHQDAYSKYTVASDISPTTIPTLLRSAFGRTDPLLIWHVRSIEIWYDRTSWLDWKPLCFNQQLHEDPTESDSTPWKWQDGELEEYLADIEDQFDAMFETGDEDIREQARDQFEGGLDGILKMLLIAYCPRLRDVKFITKEVDYRSTLGWLKRLIQGSVHHGSHWPPGLCGIREVAVGVKSETWMTKPLGSDDDHSSNVSMEVFSNLLHLPRLDSIYYKHLERPDQDDNIAYNYSMLMPKRSSTVKHVFLDDCGDMPGDFEIALSKAPLALETFTLRTGFDSDLIEGSDALVHDICSGQAGSLHTLMFYGPYDGDQIHGYRCSCYRNEELRDGRNLQTVAIDISDVELDCLYDCSEDGEMTEEEQRKTFIRWFRETAFPGSIERLVFWGNAPEYHLDHVKGNFLDWLEDALIDVIESHRWMEGWDTADEEEYDKLSTAYESFYGNLQAVYLEDIEKQYRDTILKQGGPFTEKVFFQRLVEVGKEAGIDIHTLTNRAPAMRTHNFPTAPDKWDLQTGPWWHRREEIKNWVFDVYKGRMVPPGCGKCGKCGECLSLYTAELWRSLDVSA